ncbi:hypothetical protein [Nonomuraea sp. WAC 01424]|uniref:hypothetical protein n=1 Tax=Nonomuraea sp. WAC 01424 TaxID=2203200 RepID=UPI00163CB923|nr:hypothetical protein [Nonomuraea sp. WAC 01424]
MLRDTSHQLTRGDHLDNREDPFAEPSWWRHRRTGRREVIGGLIDEYPRAA